MNGGDATMASGTGVADANSAGDRNVEAVESMDPLAHCAAGRINESAGNLEAAYARYSAAWIIDAKLPAAAIGLSRVLNTLDQPEFARAVAEATRAQGVVDSGLLRVLGAARLKGRDYTGAVEAFLASLDVEPHVQTLADLGAAYILLNQVDRAIAACEAALRLEPSHAGATNNLGCARARCGWFDDASALFERAIALGSDDAHINLGVTRLLLGDCHGAWWHYGWTSAERRRNLPFASLPLWTGTPAPEKRLLVWPEQGIGDIIQFLRFIPRARTRVGSIVLACPPGTLDLFRTVDGVDALIDLGETPQLGSADLWIPTVQLPAVFDVGLDSIPAQPYLRADPARVERFRPWLAGADGLRVGLVWSGDPRHLRDAERSCPLTIFEGLNAVSNVTWFALQQGDARAHEPLNGMQLIPINAEVADFADTAAIIEHLDLVITVDTSVAHLAGALGRPAWVLITKHPDWRWQLHGTSSPWYPTLRLFRQSDDRQWEPVVATIAAELEKLRAGYRERPAR